MSLRRFGRDAPHFNRSLHALHEVAASRMSDGNPRWREQIVVYSASYAHTVRAQMRALGGHLVAISGASRRRLVAMSARSDLVHVAGVPRRDVAWVGHAGARAEEIPA